MSGRQRDQEAAAAHRFRKGTSGNPNGRPKATPEAAARSAFDVIIKRTLTISRSGKAREVTVEEALQHRTFEDALAGNRTARREVLRMIVEREQWRAERAPKPKPEERKIEPRDSRNADGAMLLLGIAEFHPNGLYWLGDRCLLLARWAVRAALARRRPRLSDHDLRQIERCTASEAPDPRHGDGE